MAKKPSVVFKVLSWMLISLMLLPLTGCSKVNKALDPTELGRFRPTPAVNVILDSTWVADITNEFYTDSLPQAIIDTLEAFNLVTDSITGKTSLMGNFMISSILMAPFIERSSDSIV